MVANVLRRVSPGVTRMSEWDNSTDMDMLALCISSVTMDSKVKEAIFLSTEVS
jgi:hypothetical protein